jgi:hypothetical protein
MAIKLKQIGPIGEQIAEMLIPEQGKPDPAQLQMQIQQMQQELQQAALVVDKLNREKQGKVIEGQFKLEEKKMELAMRMTESAQERLTRLAVANITTKAQNEQQRNQEVAELEQQFHSQAHDVGMQAVEQQHEQTLAQQQQESAMAQQASQQMGDAQSQESAQAAQPQT